MPELTKRSAQQARADRQTDREIYIYRERERWREILSRLHGVGGPRAQVTRPGRVSGRGHSRADTCKSCIIHHETKATVYHIHIPYTVMEIYSTERIA